ncbi:MAG: cellulase family glycosylhydrolase [Saprospiraceae bacterium]|nr:cellulase family glycosylhydrolase [Lewinella sp.]
MRLLTVIILTLFFLPHSRAQPQTKPVYIDKNGVMRWSDSREEASFFGVNYTVPFAYGYRSHQALHVDLKEAIRNDVYHLKRLGFDAFRVHVWDTEISDTLGHLLGNEHLDLFDFLISELKKRDIKTLITPIAFWGNGYPERDEDTPGFSRKYGKGRATREEDALAAQERYLTQFFHHVNPYTGLTYGQDEDVIAMEINNEPSHSGPKPGVTAYIDRMIDAVRSTGWQKPIFYNISQNPWYADAVARSKADGYAFQWYPTGLVANRTLQGNYLQNVDHYSIPFGDTIPEFRNKPLMVYEFDAGDILQSNMYPIMARSFREAGFQWATQFAYDPLATAYGNTEYQTHFVNLAYSPGKAISLMIASEVFHRVPPHQQFADYPLDTTFGDFTVSYRQDLSLMNSDEVYYHSNSTGIVPKDIEALQHIAGVGQSPIVQYSGTGAYFLDKVSPGVWRLEVMPDALIVNDPFGRASPRKTVSRLVWKTQELKIQLQELGASFAIRSLTGGQQAMSANTADRGAFTVTPGVYLLADQKDKLNGISVSDEFVAPPQKSTDPEVVHYPPKLGDENEPLPLKVLVATADTSTKVFALLSEGPWQRRRINLQETAPYTFTGTIAPDLIHNGLLRYRIIVQQGDNFLVNPGNIRENPFAWDYYHNDETYEVFIAAKDAPITLFDATRDQGEIMYYNRRFRDNRIIGTATEQTGRLAVRLDLKNDIADNALGFQYYFGGEDYTNRKELSSYQHLTLQVRNDKDSELKLTVKLIDQQANAFTADVIIEPADGFQQISIPLAELHPAPSLQLPRPYPGFQDLWQESAPGAQLKLAELEKVEVLAFSEPALKVERKVLDITEISLVK